MSQLQPSCSAALVAKFTTMTSGMKAQVSLKTRIKAHDLVYQIGLEPETVDSNPELEPKSRVS